MRVASWLWLIGSLSLAGFGLGCQHEPLEVARVDLQQIAGKWFEIAKLPRPTQAGCTGTTAEYQLKSSRELLVVNECREGSLSGPLKRASARAVANDPGEPGKLSLDFGFAYGDYWVIDAGEQYEYLVVGHPSRDYLWILSRARTLPDATLSGVLERARQKGFAVGILSYTEQ
jgi:apolipoprotein D and lipocalin family protein